MKIIEKGFDDKGLKTLFEDNNVSGGISFGTVTILPGERVPKEGLSKHKEDEYSVIIEGEIEGESGGEPYSVSQSNATLIPAEEEHWAINSSDKPCKIVWALVSKE